MTDDYQGADLPAGMNQDGMDSLLNDLGAEQSSKVDPGEADPTPETDTNPEEAKDPAQPAIDDEAVARSNEAFAQMRAANSQYKKFIDHLMKGANFQGSEEDFITQLTDLSYENQAKHQNIGPNPELLKRIDTLEETNNQLIEAQNRQMFIANMETLTNKFNLSEAEVKEFVEKAVAEDIDLTIPGTNFVTLYQGLFFDKIRDKLIEQERQAWIANSDKADSASKPDGKSGKKDSSPTDVNTMAELTSLLQNMNPKN